VKAAAEKWYKHHYETLQNVEDAFAELRRELADLIYDICDIQGSRTVLASDMTVRAVQGCAALRDAATDLETWLGQLVEETAREERDPNSVLTAKDPC
jgi:hypothetical protein